MTAINSGLNAPYVKTGYVLLPDGKIFALDVRSDAASYGLTGFLQRSSVALPASTGAPPPSGPSAPAPSLTTAQANSIYLAILNRPLPTDGSAISWATNDANLAHDLAYSSEALGYLQSEWNHLIGTPIDPNWQAAQQNFLAGGGTLAAVVAGLAASSTVTANLGTIYARTTGQAVDPNWVAAQQSFLAGLAPAFRTS